MSGVFSDGFQTTESPQTSASAAFHDHTATGKLNALMTPTDAERVPLLHHPVAGALGGDGEAVQLAGQADGEVADVDHLLHLAEALGADLAGLDGDQGAEVVLVFAQQLAELADELAAHGGRDRPPVLKGLVRGGDGVRHLRGGVRAQPGELAAGDRRARDEVSVVLEGGHAEPGQDR